MTTAAEKRGLVHASKMIGIDSHGPVFDTPPGEKPEDELSGAALSAVMDRHFATMEEDLKAASAPAKLQFHQVKDIRVNRVGRWCLITVKFKGKKGQPNEFTFRIGRPWAGVLSDRLARVLSR